MSVIGRLDWSGCAGCVFTDPVSGGCTVDEQELVDNLAIDLDSKTVSCGCFTNLK